jgi:hypothetical protein
MDGRGTFFIQFNERKMTKKLLLPSNLEDNFFVQILNCLCSLRKRLSDTKISAG